MARRYQLNDPGRANRPLSGIDYETALNGQQLAAVTAGTGAYLVIAGAGSGKTRTLTYRVAWLIDQGVMPENILLLTFTNKAAREMLERVRALVPANLDNLWGGTFHSIANKILRRHAALLGYTPSFSIMDSDDSKSLLKSIVKQLGLNDKASRFPKAEVLASILSLANNTGVKPERVIDEDYPYLMKFSDSVSEVFKLYVQRKHEANAMDFDDLLVNAVRLLEENEDLRVLYGQKFEYILVDEYQDTNALQSRLIDLLAIEHGNITVVGDDAQSIYSWRGADVEHILNFHVKYPEAETFKIETNYRSVPEILELSNAAIAPNTAQIPKELKSARSGGEMAPALIALPDSRTQALFVGQRIEELIDEGIRESEIAVLYRAHFHSMEVQMELTRRRIPYRITSGVRFFEQAHIKDVLSFLRFYANPQDEISFRRMVSLLHGIGSVAAEKLWRQWSELVHDKTAEYIRYADMAEFRVPAKAKPGWLGVCDIIASFASAGDSPLPSYMLQQALDGFYNEYMETAFDNYDQRFQDIMQLASYSERFESLDDFLSQMALLSNTDEEQEGGDAGEKITLSTIHQAKGLEWKVVFVIGLSEGMFPHQRALEDDSLHALEEERRLFYVAITRAEDQLYLTYPRYNSKSFGADFTMRPSRFLDEFPPHLVEEWQVG